MIYSESANISFLVMPKNASESISRSLKEGFSRVSPKIKTLPNTTFICILRDPYERWISGTVEEFLYPSTDRYYTAGDMIKILKKRLDNDSGIIHNSHTIMQCDIYKWKKFKTIEFYNLTPTTLRIIKDKHKCFDRIHNAHVSSRGKRLPYKLILTEWIYANNHEQTIRNLLQRDYDFVSKIKFQNA